MANKITFRMAAWSDAAGKYDPNAPLNGNEDNFYVDDDLSDEQPSHIVVDEDTQLSNCGMLMAVADGMGGMNAGEMASQIAHDTVADFFAPGKITPQLAATHESRSRYMENLIREADRRIKDDARHNRDHEGMGSTLIMAWLVDNELSVTWIGDSRAYRFNPQNGIEPLSKDHSYVQELVDKGIITYEQTFEHPQGNIITRSLGDGSKKAQAESRLFKVFDGDIILLCSDGLSGVLRDRRACDENGEPYPGETLEDIIREHSSSLCECREALWAAAERADWYDNVTAILCEIRSGAGTYAPTKENEEQTKVSNPANDKLHNTFDGFIIKIPRKRVVPFLILLLLAFFAVGGGVWYKVKNKPKEIVAVSDTVKVNSDDSSKLKVDSGNYVPTAQKELLPNNDKINKKGTSKQKGGSKGKDQKKDSVNDKRNGALPFTFTPIKTAKKDTDKITPVKKGADVLTPANNKGKKK